jgi:hypothetical protein
MKIETQLETQSLGNPSLLNLYLAALHGLLKQIGG